MSSQPVSKAPVVLVTAGALFDRDTQSILMCQRPLHKSHPGDWEFPGGKIDQGETPQQALVRELHEELGILTDPNAMTPAGFISHQYTDIHVVMLLFLIKEWRGQITLHEHMAMEWVPLDRLSAFAALPADVPLLEHLHKYLN